MSSPARANSTTGLSSDECARSEVDALEVRRDDVHRDLSAGTLQPVDQPAEPGLFVRLGLLSLCHLDGRDEFSQELLGGRPRTKPGCELRELDTSLLKDILSIDRGAQLRDRVFVDHRREQE